MNQNVSPLVPQGSLLEQKNKGRARVKIAVFVVLAVHGIGLMALLMQGCKPSTTQSNFPDVVTNTAPTMAEEPVTNAAPIPDTNQMVGQTPVSNPPTTIPEPLPQAQSNLPSTPVVPPAQFGAGTTDTTATTGATGTTSDHKIVKGDTLGKLARDYHVSLQALRDANPGVNESRLRIDQIIHIPAASVPTTTTPSASVASGGAATGAHTYKVKSGDTLTRIASQNGVTVKALRAANRLKTDAIRVGQTLTIPTKGGGAATPAADAGTNPGMPELPR